MLLLLLLPRLPLLLLAQLGQGHCGPEGSVSGQILALGLAQIQPWGPSQAAGWDLGQVQNWDVGQALGRDLCLAQVSSVGQMASLALLLTVPCPHRCRRCCY